MSILTTSDVAGFLGIDASTSGLGEAITQAEFLIAGRLNLETLELATYTDERRVLTYPVQQIIPRHGPIRDITKFELDTDISDTDADDELANVMIDSSGWSIKWEDPVTLYDYDRVRNFPRMAKVTYSYQAGWTGGIGSYPLPGQIKEAIKSKTGLVLRNLLGSGAYDVKLGDMTIKMQRETLEKNLEIYDRMLSRHARPML